MTDQPSLFDPHPPPPNKPTAHREPMPAWLLRHLEQNGHIDSITYATRRARAVYCPDCRHPVVRGLTSLPTAWSADCDPTPLSPEGEVLAILAKMQLYELRWIYNSYELERRDAYQIRNSPLTTATNFDVLVEHRCKTIARWPTMDSKLKAHQLEAPQYDTPPF